MSEAVSLPAGCMGMQPKDVRGPCAAGIDIRPGSWDIVCADIQMSAAGVAVVRPTFIGKVRDEQDTLFVLRQYRVRVAVCDTRPETTLAKRLQTAGRPAGIEIWRAEYNTAPSTVEMIANEQEMLLKLDRTMAIDAVHYALQTGLSVVLPQNYREITRGEFAREMTNSTRVPTRWMGKDCYAWENQGADHSLHAFAYLLAAVRKSNLIAYGGLETMGATPGLVESGASPMRRGLEWGDEEDDDGLYLEA